MLKMLYATTRSWHRAGGAEVGDEEAACEPGEGRTKELGGAGDQPEACVAVAVSVGSPTLLQAGSPFSPCYTRLVSKMTLTLSIQTGHC